MHTFILSCFKAAKSLWHFLKIVCVFCIMMLLLFWIQNLTKGNWAWMGFITPFLSNLLDVANGIYPVSFEFWGAVFEFKYVSAIVILVGLYYFMNLLTMLTALLEVGYSSTHYICKKTEEVMINQRLKEDIEKEESKIKKYTVTIHTVIKPKFSHKELKVDINEQNRMMLDFVEEKLGVRPLNFEGGFLYQFDDFNKIDNVLRVLFKVLNFKAPLDYAMCIQAGDNIKQLQKLIGLKHYGKITMAADTVYRYRFNAKHGFQTFQIGVFRSENSTMEVHEFKEFVV